MGRPVHARKGEGIMCVSEDEYNYRPCFTYLRSLSPQYPQAMWTGCLLLLFFCLLQTVEAEVMVSSDLNCDFTNECHWRNATDDSGDWLLSQKLDVNPNLSVIPMKENESNFAYTTGLMGRTMAMLVSEVINCQLGGAALKYWYYKTGQESQLEVCIRQPPGSREPTALRCYDGSSMTNAQQWVFRVIELPPVSQPFELIFRAFYYPPDGIFALDDITYEAALCEIANAGSNQGAGGGFDDPTIVDTNAVASVEDSDILLANTDKQLQTPIGEYDPAHRPLNFAAPTLEATASPPPSPRIGKMFTSACPLIDCTFDSNSLCNYNTGLDDAVDKVANKWKLSSRGVLNSVTGIPHDLSKDGFFAYAGSERVQPQETFVLSTKSPFDIKEESRLDFFVYQAGIRGRLRICLDTLTHCPLILQGSNIGLDARRWKNYYVNLQPGTHAVHFVAEGLHENYVIGLDNIQLLNRFGTASAAC